MLFTLSFITKQGLAQILPKEIKAKINEIDSICQSCLDAGTNNFVDCENIKRPKMDSILNVVYNELKKEMDPARFKKLKKEQRVWLKKRDANYASYTAKIGESQATLGAAWGLEADKAMAVSSDSYFIEQRILYLLKKISIVPYR